MEEAEQLDYRYGRGLIGQLQPAEEFKPLRVIRYEGRACSIIRKSETKEAPQKTELTPEIVEWYAGKLSLDPKDPKQYAEAERQLNMRMIGGYWKVIARGEPLAEEAGNCMENYCLVRGLDACTVCRERDLLIKSNKSTEKVNISKTNITLPGTRNLSDLQKEPVDNEKGKNFIDNIFSWIRNLLSIVLGG